jgi:hypothetical protein
MSENDKPLHQSAEVEHKEPGFNSSPEDQARPGSFIDLPTRFDRWEPLAELIASIVLALATVATAWSGYQAARWGGVQSTSYSQAGALRTESTRASTRAGQIMQVDIGLFTNWINAYGQDQQELANFYQERFRLEFMPAFEAWIATQPRNNPDAPKSPFVMAEYNVVEADEAIRLEEEAEIKFKEGEAANQTGDNYIFNTVILASVLFLAGIQSRLNSIPSRLIMLLFSLSILAYGLIRIIQYPIQ